MPKKLGPYLRKSPTPVRPRSHFIREWREWADLTQQELGEKADLSGGAISGYEKGDNDPSVDSLKAIAAALDITPGMLLDVDPGEDAPLWTSYRRADKKQREALGRMAEAVVGPAKAPAKPRK